MSYQKLCRTVIINGTNNNAGDNVIVPGGQLGAGIGSIRVWQLVLNSTGPNVITPKSGSTVVGGQIVHTGNGSSTTEQNIEQQWMQAASGQDFVLNFTNGGVTTGTLWYTLA